MSIVNFNDMETKESSEYLELNEIYYNCTECSSTVELISINETECSIEFKCIKNNHYKKIPIKEYINKMKDHNNKDINNDICIIHNNKYECYCLDCNKHLCKECLKLREHISHNKIIIIEIQPNKKELNIIENIIKYYEDKIEKLENDKALKTKEISDKYKKMKYLLNETKIIKAKENIENMEKELKLNKDNYNLSINNIKKKYANEAIQRKYKYIEDINKITNKYKLLNEYNNIIYNNKIENLDNKYIKIIQLYGYDEKIENMKNIKRLNEIVYNTYNIYNNNYYNSININNILENY